MLQPYYPYKYKDADSQPMLLTGLEYGMQYAIYKKLAARAVAAFQVEP